jgi:hypothetical protein
MSLCGRIWFPGNPWPTGHAIQEFRWSGRLDTGGRLWFDLHLETVDYHSEGPPGLEHEDSWRSPVVWGNYGNCTLSSTFWQDEGSTGLLAGSAEAPLDWASLVGREFWADPADEGATIDQDQEPAFRIYLLGHDAVAAHRVRFRDGSAPGVFDIEWTGRIALAYTGEHSLLHTFRAQISGAKFEGFELPQELTESEARERLRAACIGGGPAMGGS